ncbi:hypothetical protein ACH5RR_005691 [Cinchona calisaya]|uniref:Aluminum-activated malate transporter n=1 Tax=Cinchona calisaya TaxID=153742 RepID=A0ABD3ALX5_9GENT
MEIDSKNQEKTGLVSCVCGSIRACLRKLKEKAVIFAKKTNKVGRDDPRRIVHSTKVGLALTIVSLLYYFRPLYDGFGQSGMWAILTVVVVFEFTVGGTLCKCLNRGFATFTAGALGIGAEHFASLCGEKGKPIILGLSVFFLAATSTFIRFFPHIKRRYDYGVLIFILTFSLVTVSGYRVEQIFELAHQRISTILIGAATCMIISIFLYPVWAGKDLHNLVASNIEKLANFLEGFGGENSFVLSQDDNSFLQDYTSVLNTKATEESLANLAWWEPSHGGFRFSHPWKQYLEIGALVRECACQLEALSSCNKSQPKAATDIQRKIRKPCKRMSSEAGKALKEIASAIKAMRHPSSSTVETHVRNSKSAVDELTSVLETLSSSAKPPADHGIMEITQAIAIASILVEIIKCVERISESVFELSKQARFNKNCSTTLSPSTTTTPPEKTHILHHGKVKLVNHVDGGHVVILVRDTTHEHPPPPVTTGE